MTRTSQILLISVAMAGGTLWAASPMAHRPKVLLDNSTVHVVAVSIAANAAYKVHADTPKESIWVAIDGPALILAEGKGGRIRAVSPSDIGKFEFGSGIEFRNKGTAPAEIVIVGTKVAGAVPECVNLTAGNALEEHTPDNGVVVVAISALRLREVMQLGEPDDPTPGNPTIIKMNSGDIRWLEPGMRTLSNLLGDTVRFVWIGW